VRVSGETVFLSFDVIGQPGDLSDLSLAKFECNEIPASGGFYTEGRVCSRISLRVDESEAGTAFIK
ncbi:hypothetical protein QUF80_22005, partial [Desulfococcaceae bacterium HSG8]|nr:hypothetical protein [Desulfococcaceae bacterium HSG8]